MVGYVAGGGGRGVEEDSLVFGEDVFNFENGVGGDGFQRLRSWVE